MRSSARPSTLRLCASADHPESFRTGHPPRPHPSPHATSRSGEDATQSSSPLRLRASASGSPLGGSALAGYPRASPAPPLVVRERTARKCRAVLPHGVLACRSGHARVAIPKHLWHPKPRSVSLAAFRLMASRSSHPSESVSLSAFTSQSSLSHRGQAPVVSARSESAHRAPTLRSVRALVGASGVRWGPQPQPAHARRREKARVSGHAAGPRGGAARPPTGARRRLGLRCVHGAARAPVTPLAVRGRHRRRVAPGVDGAAHCARRRPPASGGGTRRRLPGAWWPGGHRGIKNPPPPQPHPERNSANQGKSKRKNKSRCPKVSTIRTPNAP